MNVRPKNGKPVWRSGGRHVGEDLAKIAEEVASIVRKENAQASLNTLQDIPAASKILSPPTKVSQTPKILIVDDDPRFRNSILQIFEGTDIDFFEAGTVKEGIALLSNVQDIKVIMLDLSLPGEDGTELLEQIKDQASSYRIIILTAHEELLAAEKAKSYDIFSYLPKAARFSAQSLQFAVWQALEDISENSH